MRDLIDRLYGLFHQTHPSEPMAPTHYALIHFVIAHSSRSLLSIGRQSNLHSCLWSRLQGLQSLTMLGLE